MMKPKASLLLTLLLGLSLPLASQASVTAARAELVDRNISMAHAELNTALASDPANVEAAVLRAITRLLLLTTTPELKAVAENHVYGTMNIDSTDWMLSAVEPDGTTEWLYTQSSDAFDGTDYLMYPTTWSGGSFSFKVTAMGGDSFSLYYYQSPPYFNGFTQVIIDDVVVQTITTFESWVQYQSPGLTAGEHEVTLRYYPGFYVFLGYDGNFNPIDNINQASTYRVGLDAFTHTGAAPGTPTGATVANALDHDGFDWPRTPLISGHPAVSQGKAIQDVVDFLVNQAKPALLASINDLAVYTDDGYPYVSLYEQELSGSPITGGGRETKIDYGDAQLLQSILYNLCAAIDVLQSHDWQDGDGLGNAVESYQLYFLVATSLITAERLFETYPELLSLLTENEVDSAGNAIDQAIARYDVARDYIRNSRPLAAQADRLFILSPEEADNEADLFAHLRQRIPEGQSIKTAQTTELINGSTQPLAINLAPFFAGNLNINSHKPALFGNQIRIAGLGQHTFPHGDATFAGTLPEMTESRAETELLRSYLEYKISETYGYYIHGPGLYGNTTYIYQELHFTHHHAYGPFGVYLFEDWRNRFGYDDSPESHINYFKGYDRSQPRRQNIQSLNIRGPQSLYINDAFMDVYIYRFISGFRDNTLGYYSEWQFTSGLDNPTNWQKSAFPLLTFRTVHMYIPASEIEADKPISFRQIITWPSFDGNLNGYSIGNYFPDSQTLPEAEIFYVFTSATTGNFDSPYDSEPPDAFTCTTDWIGNRLTIEYTFASGYTEVMVLQFTGETSGRFSNWIFTPSGMMDPYVRSNKTFEIDEAGKVIALEN